MSVREDKKKAKREVIVDAAMRLFEKQGFEQTTFAQIARKSGVSIRTCTRYFPSKMDLVFTFHEERLERFKKLLEKHHKPENPIEGIRLAFLEMADVYENNKEDYLRESRFISASSVLSMRDMELDKEYERAIAEVLMRGRFDETESKIIAGTVFLSVRATMHQWYEENCARSLKTVGLFTFSLLDWLRDSYKERAANFASQAGGLKHSAKHKKNGRNKPDKPEGA